MDLYSAIDLHSTSSQIAVIDADGRRVARKKIPNDAMLINAWFSTFKGDLRGIVVESTYNWYWLVDALMNDGFKVHLANPSAIQKYSGLKHVDDTHDAFWLAEMLRLGILPEGYIYPKAERPVRDLLRKRSHLVRLRTSLIISLQNIIARNCGVAVRASEVKLLREDCIAPFLDGNEDLAMAGAVSKETIDFLTRKIRSIETVVKKRVELKQPYRHLLTIPGVGRILSLTIMLETGPISRFRRVGDYASYCRKVDSQWTSNGKKKGSGNKKNGNKYLSWAFSEAAEFARRFNESARNYYNRKTRKTNFMVAHNALAHKLARATYHVMKDEVPFRADKLFG